MHDAAITCPAAKLHTLPAQGADHHVQAYRGVRSAGEDDVGTILLSIASDLEAFDFHDTFTGNFEVCAPAIRATHASGWSSAAQYSDRLYTLRR
jgi:hypothetical protein